MVLDVPVIAERPAEPVNTPLVSHIHARQNPDQVSNVVVVVMVDVLNVAIMGCVVADSVLNVGCSANQKRPDIACRVRYHLNVIPLIAG
jgi:hypothetical protein